MLFCAKVDWLLSLVIRAVNDVLLGTCLQTWALQLPFASTDGAKRELTLAPVHMHITRLSREAKDALPMISNAVMASVNLVSILSSSAINVI